MENQNEEFSQFVSERLDRIYDYVRAQKIPTWGNKEDSRIVSLKEIAELLNDVEACLPDSIRKAISVVNEENGILERARREAEIIEEDARKQEDIIVVSANNYKQQVEEYAQKLIDEAKQHECQKKDEADQYYAERRKKADELYEDTVFKANQDADSIIEEAKAKAEELISENEITKNAEERANELRRRTLLWSQRICDNARSMADDILSRFLETLKEYEGAVMTTRAQLGAEDGQADDENNRYENDGDEYGDDEERYTDADKDYKGPLSKIGDLFKRM